jgi:two-component system, cell cycle sensor histidine kinase and response regulator CckA
LDSRGTRVSVQRSEAAAVRAGDIAVPDGLGHGVILLVEDHPTLRETLVLALNRAGYQIHAAGSEREAMECWHGHASEVDLLLVDCGLGFGSGRVLASELRHERPELRVLYVSGAPEHLPERESLGPHEACLIKPFGSQSLLSAIEGLLPAR